MNRGGRYSDNQRQGYGNQGYGNQRSYGDRRQGGGIQQKMRNTRNQISSRSNMGGRGGSRGGNQGNGPRRQQQQQRYNDNQNNNGGYLRNRQGGNQGGDNRRDMGLRRRPQINNAYRSGGAQAYGRRQIQGDLRQSIRDNNDMRSGGDRRRIGINQRSKRIIKTRGIGTRNQDRQGQDNIQSRQYQRRQMGTRQQAGKTLGQRRPRQQQQRPKNTQQNKTQQRPRVSGTGTKGMVKLPDAASLKTLQVKAELNKLGEAPRAYLEKLEFDSMQVDNHPGRVTLDSRFNKIQGARPNLSRGSIGGQGKTLRLVNRPKQAGSRRY